MFELHQYVEVGPVEPIIVEAQHEDNVEGQHEDNLNQLEANEEHEHQIETESDDSEEMEDAPDEGPVWLT